MADAGARPADRARAGTRGEGPEITLVRLVFAAASPPAADRLVGVLAKYVVVSRQQPGCHDIDLCQGLSAHDLR